MDQARRHELATIERGARVKGAPLAVATARAAEWGDGLRGVVLVEGLSDQFALEALAQRLGRDLDDEGIAVVSLGGVTTIGRFLDLFGPGGLDVALAGLCDIGEERAFRRGLERVGWGTHLDRAGMESLGFHACDADLEDELIRALGTDAVLAVVDSQGELGSFHIFQEQPAQRERSTHDQLHRFFGTRSGRKILYAPLLVEALPVDDVPRPLLRVLAHV